MRAASHASKRCVPGRVCGRRTVGPAACAGLDGLLRETPPEAEPVRKEVSHYVSQFQLFHLPLSAGTVLVPSESYKARSVSVRAGRAP